VGIVFAFELNVEVIGTFRMIPMQFGLTLTEQLLAQVEPDFRTRWPHSWECGRLVLAPEYRVGADVLKRCLYLVAQYMASNTNTHYVLGSCTHVLSRLYRRFGFNLLVQNVILQGTEKSYTLIHSPLEPLLVTLGPGQ
jgi:N-acyl amino acid synthase FeeM